VQAGTARGEPVVTDATAALARDIPEQGNASPRAEPPTHPATKEPLVVWIRTISAWLTLGCLVYSSGDACAGAPASAAEVLRACDVSGGLVVHLGCGDGKQTAGFRANDHLLVHGLAADSAQVAAARKHLDTRGLYGPVSLMQWDRPYLPYRDNMVNLLYSEDPGNIDDEEILRVLAPRGSAYVKRNGKWQRTVKPWPEEIGQWTHWLQDAGNNPVAADTRVGPPNHMQWKCGPLWARSHDRCPPSTAAMVSANGRLFYIYDEGMIGLPRMPARWTLIARDAFNGVLLWKRPLGHNDRWRLAVAGDRVLVTLGKNDGLSILDAATGQVQTTCESAGTPRRIMHCDGRAIVYARDGGKDHLAAVEPETGKVHWKKQVQAVTGGGPEALAAHDGRLFYATDDGLSCRSLADGEQLWENEHSAKRVIARGGVVLAGNTVFSADDGKQLWKVRGGGHGGPIFASGLLWPGVSMLKHSHPFHWAPEEAVAAGYDPATGEKKAEVEVPRLITPGHHFRCYPAKATERYILLNKRGVEFFDLRGDNHMRCDWLRAPCRHGAVACNGLLYMSTSPCFCYPGVKLSGFNAMSTSTEASPRAPADRGPRLRRGPAWDARGKGEPADGEDWPLYRHDPRRSGSTDTTVPTRLGLKWESVLSGRISPPVAAWGKVFVAEIDRHRVTCLDAGSGRVLWTFTADARVDSPPALHRGLVLFGSTDGRVYCLRADDGAQVWTFDAAPRDRLVTVFGQLESAWPVHGSVLVQNGKAYVSAGRSSFLDGGMYYFALDPETGKLLHRARLESPRPDVAKEAGLPYDMEGTRTDLLVGDGEDVYQFFVRFNPDLTRQETPRITKLGDREVSQHLMTNAGLLDTTWFDRSYWIHDVRWPGFYFAYDAPKSGQILVFDDETTYGLHVFRRRSGHSPVFDPGQGKYELYADDNANRAVLRPMEIGREKGTSFTRQLMPKWSEEIPVRARAMVLAGDRLYLAGPPDVVPGDDPLAAFEGRLGAKLWVVAAESGRRLEQYHLAALPAFDGLIAARGNLYLSTTDGRLLCIGDARQGQPLKPDAPQSQ
jgi:outer membrane protein assembly factor BamB